MNKFKIIFLSLLALIDVFLVIISIGYLSMAIAAPNTLGGRAVTFTGNYILFALYCLVIILVTTLFLFCLVKWIRNK